jgi:tetratricopeptide (TPR) repeat protein
MEILLGMLIATGYILALLVLRSITTLVHELGHALPALFFTEKMVTVHVGTYGDLTNSYKVEFGRVQIFFRFNLLDWQKGLCEHQGITNIWKALIVTAGGPIASLFISIPLFLIVLNRSLSEFQLTLTMAFVLAAMIDFFVNIIPAGKPIQLHDGTSILNDGAKISMLFSRLRLPEQYLELESKFEQKLYEEVIEGSRRLLDEGHKDKAYYELLILALVQEKRYEDALDVYETYRENFKLKYRNYREIGSIYMKMNNYEEAMKYFNYCLHIEYKDADVLNELGYLKIQQGRYQDALADLDAAIEYSPEKINTYLNRGLAKTRLKDYPGAYQDFMKSKKFNGGSPDLPFYLGVYHEQRNEYLEALENYNRAKVLNGERQGLDYKIADLEEKLKSE